MLRSNLMPLMTHGPTAFVTLHCLTQQGLCNMVVTVVSVKLLLLLLCMPCMQRLSDRDTIIVIITALRALRARTTLRLTADTTLSTD